MTSVGGGRWESVDRGTALCVCVCVSCEFCTFVCVVSVCDFFNESNVVNLFYCDYVSVICVWCACI